MYLVYIDETGDDGLVAGSSDHFILSALVIHESAWLKCLDDLLNFRRRLKARYGLKLTEEIHATRLISRPGQLVRIPKWQRLLLYREILDFVGSQVDWKAYHVCLNKGAKLHGSRVFELAWKALIQRLYNSVSLWKSLPAHNGNENFMLLPDVGHEKQLRSLSRKLRRYNVVPSRIAGTQSLPITSMIDDPSHRDSAHSYFVQVVDVCAYALKQRISPNGYVKKKGARNWFDRIKPVCESKASTNDPWGMGVVRIQL